MTTRINLLPYRAARRRSRLIQFGALAALAALAGAAVVGVVHGILDARVTHQESRNSFLQINITKLDRQIDEIRDLRQQVKVLLSRKDVVENLQNNRSDVVRLLDQVLHTVPEGVYLTSLKQTGDKINISGSADSIARIATFMRALDSSPWFSGTTLVQSQMSSGGANKDWPVQFGLNFNFSSKPRAPATTPAAAPQPPVAAANKKG
jgi:type IV pilus assembly protein PilN